MCIRDRYTGTAGHPRSDTGSTGNVSRTTRDKLFQDSSHRRQPWTPARSVDVVRAPQAMLWSTT
eukprot:10516380-Prorocentrum_lima.AAC.1